MVGHRFITAGVLALFGTLGGLTVGCAHHDAPVAPLPEADLVALGARMEGVTGVPLPADLATQVVQRAEVKEILRSATLAEWPPEESRRFAEGVIAMGLWPQDEDLIAALLAVSADHVGGFYLPSDRTVYVVADSRMSFGAQDGSLRRDSGREFVVTHELVHAQQHTTHPELIEFFIRWHNQDDAANAASAAIEGHALHAAIEILTEARGLPTPEMIAKYFGAEPGGELGEVPAFIRLTHAFPYVRGYPLAYREGASLLDRAPASTEQVMHEERREDDFWAMDLAGTAAVLPQDCEIVYENTLGELGISVMFDELSGAPDPEIWTGWDGDRYLAARCGQERALLWLTAWDTREDARQFAEAYASVAPQIARRAGYYESPRALQSGRAVIVVSAHLKDVVPHLSGAVRRARVATLAELRAHFDGVGVAEVTP